MPVTKTEQSKETREFVGRAWKNVVKGENSKYKGTEYINLVFDRECKEIVIKEGGRLILWPNNKREGKQDADYRVSLVEKEA